MTLSKITTIIILLFIYIPTAQSQWSTDPNVNNVICDAALDQLYPKIVSDGSGGALITWHDNRNSNTDANIYVQRINGAGVVQWTVNGATICDITGNQDHPAIASDGSGGAIIAWSDLRDISQKYQIYAQRIDSSGVVQWTANGVRICNITDGQYSPTILSDGSGGAIITWGDWRNILDPDIFAQRINSSGEVQWAENGITICEAAGGEQLLSTVSDGSGGAIIAWEDTRENYNDPDIYVQRINASGEVQWTGNGVLISDAYSSGMPTCTSDGSGGAIIAWADHRDSIYNHIYVQRIDSTGDVQWAPNGVSIRSIEFGGGVAPTIASDGAGGAIIAWEDLREGILGFDIYAQKIDSSGIVQWTTNGVSICQAVEYQVVPKIISDGSGGAIITWGDKRGGGVFGDIYAQKINSSGIVQWVTDGVAISTAVQDQNTPVIVSDGSGGGIISWSDKRNFSSYDIYAQQINTDGNLGVVTDVAQEPGIVINFALLQNYPNPFNPSTKIKFAVPERSNVLIKVYDILGGEVITLVNQEMDAGWYENDFNASGLSSGVYFIRMEAGKFVSIKKMILLQ